MCRPMPLSHDFSKGENGFKRTGTHMTQKNMFLLHESVYENKNSLSCFFNILYLDVIGFYFCQAKYLRFSHQCQIEEVTVASAFLCTLKKCYILRQVLFYYNSDLRCKLHTWF